MAAVVAVGAASVFWPVEWQVTRAFSPRGAVPLPVPSTTTTTTVPSTAPQSAVQPEVQPFRTAGAGPPTTTSAPAVLPDPTSAAPQLPPQAPQPRIVIAVGEPTSSSNCERGKCFWIDARLTGFAPNTRYDVIAMGNERDFSEPCRSVTDANGADQCGDTRYDVPGAKVYVYVTTPQGKVFSNTITWPSG
ncbi:hypothetical protein FHS29_002351 [Saccharothrix tamanrassetensis]|uniref:Uncharacterized protein n=1 Tax=Saccharothrix tamanrassetensis TaxID=1051531 RepID=A0A841CFK0_9PSEU|nr:hypothetical protein [Saccharothrix tamanrassetensis]MBB5955770.1 hypothetical protein [Saccharothrix tamanrassetensis]